MKKSLVITLVLALLLVLCVSCSSDGKKGKIVIDTSALKDFEVDEDVQLFDVAEQFNLLLDTSIFELDMKKVKKGEVSVKVPTGMYTICQLGADFGEEEYETDIYLERVARTKVSDPCVTFVVVNPGQTVYLVAYGIHQE